MTLNGVEGQDGKMLGGCGESEEEREEERGRGRVRSVKENN